MKLTNTQIISFAAATALSLGGALYAHEGHKHVEGKEAKAKTETTITMTGEVLDLSCYLGHEGRGKEHQKCAKDCLIKKMVPAGLLTKDGQVYLLVEDHQYEKVFKQVREAAAEQVKITGRKIMKGGLQAILVEKIEKA
ncbi:MAG: hypothetical protein HYT79_04510 [Elusimicrobia bacterium]|nr:hypothetical protein [Elusimicrobiota bacterium]